MSVKLPSAAPFDSASQQGNDARVKFRLPPILRLGVEARPIPSTRIELSYAHEFWSLHDTIDVVPENIALVGVTGFPSPFTLPRRFQDSNSIHLGGEHHLDFGKGDYGLDLRLGVFVRAERHPTAYLSPLTVDMNKVTVALGDSIYVGKHWRFDLTYAHVFAFDVDVSPDEAAIGRVNPVHGNPVPVEAVNGGHYSARADVLGVGLNYKF